MRLMEALEARDGQAPPEPQPCMLAELDAYGSRRLARQAIHARSRGWRAWFGRRWHPFPCACERWHIGPRQRRIRRPLTAASS
ncbi:hypothetical protein [Sphaerisporangium sp. TRM90804]|uniref:hypothetical protein n=1 Tax=Sphaerisporangium sp. TRM90804 TaxID=3031113 RepID=UPI00244BFEC1|nr:hypothetical protein [Sphaerisporangium sp. TRM90804]MDH2425740.1 hypothetical protein [Sphaerisporangium sp. TRM90804]